MNENIYYQELIDHVECDIEDIEDRLKENGKQLEQLKKEIREFEEELESKRKVYKLLVDNKGKL